MWSTVVNLYFVITLFSYIPNVSASINEKQIASVTSFLKDAQNKTNNMYEKIVVIQSISHNYAEFKLVSVTGKLMANDICEFLLHNTYTKKEISKTIENKMEVFFDELEYGRRYILYSKCTRSIITNSTEFWTKLINFVLFKSFELHKNVIHVTWTSENMNTIKTICLTRLIKTYNDTTTGKSMEMLVDEIYTINSHVILGFGNLESNSKYIIQLCLVIYNGNDTFTKNTSDDRSCISEIFVTDSYFEFKTGLILYERLYQYISVLYQKPTISNFASVEYCSLIMIPTLRKGSLSKKQNTGIFIYELPRNNLTLIYKQVKGDCDSFFTIRMLLRDISFEKPGIKIMDDVYYSVSMLYCSNITCVRTPENKLHISLNSVPLSIFLATLFITIEVLLLVSTFII